MDSKITEFRRVEVQALGEMAELTPAALKMMEEDARAREQAWRARFEGHSAETIAEREARLAKERKAAENEAREAAAVAAAAAERAAAKAEMDAWLRAQFHKVDAQGKKTPIMCEHGQPLYSCMPCSH